MDKLHIMPETTRVAAETDRVCERDYLAAHMYEIPQAAQSVPDPNYRGTGEAPIVPRMVAAPYKKYPTYDNIESTDGSHIVTFGSPEDAKAFAQDWQDVIDQREKSTRTLRQHLLGQSTAQIAARKQQ